MWPEVSFDDLKFVHLFDFKSPFLTRRARMLTQESARKYGSHMFVSGGAFVKEGTVKSLNVGVVFNFIGKLWIDSEVALGCDWWMFLICTLQTAVGFKEQAMMRVACV